MQIADTGRFAEEWQRANDWAAWEPSLRRILSALFGLDYERSIWVEEEELGKARVIWHRKKRYAVRIPVRIDRLANLRLTGLGRTKGGRTGDLLLHVWLNKGEDARKSLWLSETSSSEGADKLLAVDDGKIQVVVPPNSHHGVVIRLKGLGKTPDFTWRAPFLRRRRGNLLVKLFVYPDRVTPQYGSFDTLSTDDMALEGWVYRKIDEVFGKMGRPAFDADPVGADAVAEAFNERGWRGIFDVLVRHLPLGGVDIQVTTSDSIPQPGNCQRTIILQTNTPAVSQSALTVYEQHIALPESRYVVTIREEFLDNPFSIAAILAHELCHIVYSRGIDNRPVPAAQGTKLEKETLEAERTVDLLVFLFKIGEFQLRVSRDSRLTLGYFNQRIFERMQGIASKKLGAL